MASGSTCKARSNVYCVSCRIIMGAQTSNSIKGPAQSAQDCKRFVRSDYLGLGSHLKLEMVSSFVNTKVYLQGWFKAEA